MVDSTNLNQPELNRRIETMDKIFHKGKKYFAFCMLLLYSQAANILLINYFFMRTIILVVAVVGVIVLLYRIGCVIRKYRAGKRLDKVCEYSIHRALDNQTLYFFIDDGKIADSQRNEVSVLEKHFWQFQADFDVSAMPDEAIRVCFSSLRSFSDDLKEMIFRPKECLLPFIVNAIEPDGYVVLEHPIMGKLRIADPENLVRDIGQKILVKQGVKKVNKKDYYFCRISSVDTDEN